MTEPDAGSDPAIMKTTAKKIDNYYVLNGIIGCTKLLVSISFI